MRFVLALAFAYLCGCSSILGLNEPVIAEREPDASVFGRCPTTYALTPTSSTTRYRILENLATFGAHEAACAQHAPGATHLVALGSVAEAAALRASLSSAEPSLRFYVGATQLRDRPKPDIAWTNALGVAVPLDLWALDQPIDGPSSHYIEDNEANVAELALDSTSGFLYDTSGELPQMAICECEP